MEHTVTTPDGRELHVLEDGEPTGRPVLVHFGTPSAGFLYQPHIADARAKGIRLITYDRPGYGDSTRQPGRRIGDCAADVRAITDHLGIDRLGVWGISGGGPHSLACAALLPDLVVAAAALATTAPYGAEGLDYFTGMGQDNVEDIKLSVEDPGAYEKKAEVDRQDLLGATADTLLDVWRSLVSPADEAVMNEGLAQALTEAFQHGLAHGAEGWIDESYALNEPWGFDLAGISVPVQLWHGRQDRFVPFQHGEWLVERIPGVEAHLSDDEGHLTLYERRIPEVHAWLLARF